MFHITRDFEVAENIGPQSGAVEGVARLDVLVNDVETVEHSETMSEIRSTFGRVFLDLGCKDFFLNAGGLTLLQEELHNIVVNENVVGD